LLLSVIISLGGLVSVLLSLCVMSGLKVCVNWTMIFYKDTCKCIFCLGAPACLNVFLFFQANKWLIDVRLWLLYFWRYNVWHGRQNIPKKTLICSLTIISFVYFTLSTHLVRFQRCVRTMYYIVSKNLIKSNSLVFISLRNNLNKRV